MTAKNLYDFKCEKHNQRLNIKIIESGPPGLKIVYVETCEQCLAEIEDLYTPSVQIKKYTSFRTKSPTINTLEELFKEE